MVRILRGIDPLPGGRKQVSVGLEGMLRKCLITNGVTLADAACEDALYDVPAFCDFCGLDLGSECIPDATALMNLSHLLQQKNLGTAMFTKVGELILANGLKPSGGIIATPRSTKNVDNTSDSDMHQTTKGCQRHFGMKVSIDVNSYITLAYRAVVTSANVHDSQTAVPAARQLDSTVW